MGRFLNETMPHANSRMASATTKRRLLREKSTRLRIISYAAVMPRYLPLFKRNHIGRWCMRARILHNAHEPVRQFQNPFRLAEVNRLDRKSTRLNSSHLGISYAVFCL